MLALLGVQIAFGSWSIVGKVTLNVVPPLPLVVLRLTGGALCFLAMQFLAGRPMLPPAGARAELTLLAVAGLVINQVFFVVGLRYTSAIESAVLSSAIPLFTIAYAVLSGRERGHAGLWRGLVLAVAGTAVVSWQRHVAFHDSHLLGNALILVNALSYSVYLVRARPVMARFGSDSVITWMFALAAVMTLPLGLPGLLAAAPHWSTRTWIAVAYVIAGPTAFAYSANAYALQRAPSSLVAVFIYLQPVLAILLAITLGNPLAGWLGVPPPDERLTAQIAAGMACVLGGVWIAARKS